MTESQLRLSRHVQPRRYDLEISPDLATARFFGRVSIEIHVLRTVSEIVLHALELDITEASIQPIRDGGLEPLDASPSFDKDSETATLQFGTEVTPGRYALRLEFSGTLNDMLVGFYRSTFVNHDGQEATIAVTQFEATHARRAFPCFDEPEFKASFAVTLVVEKGMLAISNGAELERTETDEGRTSIRFTETIPISTYLVAFVVGPLEATKPTYVDGVAVRIVHRPGQAHLAAFSLATASAALRYFTNYFERSYPSDKLDLVAVPDFAFGAMENLGCVTFREILLLVDPTTSTQPELQRVADVVNHEIAHMWFGDLVTMRWWNGIWLNEAFARFMEMRATDSLRPEWDRWTDFGLSRSSAFDLDALTTSRPVEFEVHSPSEAEGMFDQLTYEKGAAIVRMLEQFVGEHPFRDAIRRYIAAHEFGNTDTSDLWEAVESTVHEPAQAIMSSWISEPGFPLVEVKMNHPEVTLSQRRFSYDGDPPRAERQGVGRSPLWQIPVHYRTIGPDGAAESHRLLLKDETVTLAVPDSTRWVVFNEHSSGFFRLLYDLETVTSLSNHASTLLDPAERFSLVDDHWASVVAGRADAASFVQLAADLVADGETDLSVWQRLTSALETIVRIGDTTDAGTVVRARIGALLEGAHELVTSRSATQPSDERMIQCRAALFGSLASVAPRTDLLEVARSTYSDYQSDPSSIDAGMVKAALRIMAAQGTAEEFATLEEGFTSSPTPQEELRYLEAMADTVDVRRMAHLLDMTLGEVRTQNAPYVLLHALQNPDRELQVWDFLESNWERMIEAFPSNTIVRMLGGIRSFIDPELAERVSTFLDGHQPQTGVRTLAQHRERMEVGVRMAIREAPRLGALRL